MNWTQEEAIKVCTEIEKWCPQFGCHIALTGGCLYSYANPGHAQIVGLSQPGHKDLDIVFYRIRQRPFIDMQGLSGFLTNTMGWTLKSTHGWLTKYEDKHGRKIDVLIPELSGEYYPEDNDDKKR